MIQVKNDQVKAIMEGIHKMMLRKAKHSRQEQAEVVMESRIFSCLCADFEIEPRKCAQEMNARYGYALTGNDVIQVFREKRISNQAERRELLNWAAKLAEYFAAAVGGDREAFGQFEKLLKNAPNKSGKWVPSQERIVAIMIYGRYPELDQYQDTEKLYRLNNALARYFLYDIEDVVAAVYGFPQQWERKGKAASNGITYEQAIRRMKQLENTLDRTNIMLQELQDEFEEQLEASRTRERADFFAKLNSEKYGCILDELLVVRRGIDELGKSGYVVPIEINGLLIMVKKLIQFVRDCHIEPILKLYSVQEVTASDVEFCNYEGTPFQSADERKRVQVVSPGWIYKDKELQISRPRVKEEK